jgi:regulator of sirC expression with transglutaminase-like and TPR domain
MIESIADLGLIEDEAIPLDRAALRLAALDHAEVDLASYEVFLDRLEDEIVAASYNADTAARRTAALRAILSDKHDFRGDSDTYDDSANANLISVIDRRRGLPVALSILYVGLARRLGWKADVLNTPGHIVIGLEDEAERVVVDPFNGGRVLTAQSLQSLIAQVTGTQPPLDPAGWIPLQNRLVLVRLLNNQVIRAVQAGKIERAATLYARLTTIGPGISELWWERAQIEWQLGRNRDARASLSSLLEMTTDGERRGQVFRMLEKIPHE